MRYVLLFVIGVLLTTFVIGANYDRVRIAGESTVDASGTYYFVCDSSDTFQIDTIFSDTMTIGEFKYIDYSLGITGYNMADSANDSLLMIVEGVGSYNGNIPVVIFRDTLPNTLGTLDSTSVATGTVKIDTLPINQMYFRTIVKDSFIMGAGVDTTTLRTFFQYVEHGVIDK